MTSSSLVSGSVFAVVLGASLFVTIGCGGSDTGSASTGSGGGSTSGPSSGPGGPSTSATGSMPGTCDTDPLKTNLPALFNGNSVDMYDCDVLTYTAKYNEPDAMIFKAIIYVESRFQNDAVGCTGNTNCCPQLSWMGDECGCLGAMQTGPGCASSNTLGLLPNGHPDLAKDPTSPDWANSCFNPSVNIDLGIAGIAGNRTQEKQKYSGCTEDQYTMMAIGDFNSYGSTKSCTDYNTQYDNEVLDAYKQYAAASGWPAHSY